MLQISTSEIIKPAEDISCISENPTNKSIFQDSESSDDNDMDFSSNISNRSNSSPDEKLERKSKETLEEETVSDSKDSEDVKNVENEKTLRQDYKEDNNSEPVEDKKEINLRENTEPENNQDANEEIKEVNDTSSKQVNDSSKKDLEKDTTVQDLVQTIEEKNKESNAADKDEDESDAEFESSEKSLENLNIVKEGEARSEIIKHENVKGESDSPKRTITSCVVKQGNSAPVKSNFKQTIVQKELSNNETKIMNQVTDESMLENEEQRANANPLIEENSSNDNDDGCETKKDNTILINSTTASVVDIEVEDDNPIETENIESPNQIYDNPSDLEKNDNVDMVSSSDEEEESCLIIDEGLNNSQSRKKKGKGMKRVHKSTQNENVSSIDQKAHDPKHLLNDDKPKQGEKRKLSISSENKDFEDENRKKQKLSSYSPDNKECNTDCSIKNDNSKTKVAILPHFSENVEFIIRLNMAKLDSTNIDEFIDDLSKKVTDITNIIDISFDIVSLHGGNFIKDINNKVLDKKFDMENWQPNIYFYEERLIIITDKILKKLPDKVN